MSIAMRFTALIALALLALAIVACGGGGDPATTAASSGTDQSTSSDGDAIVVGAAGDISCDPSWGGYDREAATEPCGQLATSDALLALDPDAVLALGDLQYPEGELANFRKAYEPSWGRLIDRTRPVPGNHEYLTDGADGYFDYFGQSDAPAIGKRGKGYYAFDLGDWRVLALNTNCEDVPCDEGSQQYRWLQNQLEASDSECVLAMHHQPRFSSGDHGSSTVVEPLWDLLYRYGADVVLSGHDHIYERFAPQTPAGNLDEEHGIRQFVVGTGGGGTDPIGDPQPNSEASESGIYGVLELTLADGEYGWRYQSTPVEGTDGTGGTDDQGVASCVSPADASGA